jgi:hypothetical protein
LVNKQQISSIVANKKRKLAPMKANTLENIPPHFLTGPSVISSLGEVEDIIEDPTKKDKFGTTKALRIAISRQYEIIEVLGKGSYGCVSKA